MNFGLSTSFFKGKNPGLKDWKNIKNAGFDYVEIALLRYSESADYEEWVKAYTDGMKNYGIKLRSLHIPYGEETDLTVGEKQHREKCMTICKGFADLALKYGAEIIVVHPSWEPIKDNEREERIKYGNIAIAELAEYTMSLGLPLAVECLPRTCVGNCSNEILRLIDGTKAGVCVDVNHLVKEAPGDFIRKVGSKIITTHLSDNDGIDEKHWLLGQGVIDFDDVFKALEEVGYNTPYVFETRAVDLTDPKLVLKSAERWIK